MDLLIIIFIVTHLMTLGLLVDAVRNAGKRIAEAVEKNKGDRQ